MTEEQAFEALVLHSFRIMATVARGGVAAETIDWTGNVALLIGSEGRGLSPQWIERATQRVTLAMPGAVESLNAAVATSLLLYEISKQKAAEKKRGRQ
jgi:TrmH family RNA methyltransferase